MRKHNGSKAYLVGYYGMQNTGDDALMTVAACGLKEMLKVEQVKVSSPIPLKLYNGESLIPNQTVKQRFPGHNRLLSYMQAIESNRIVFGGGSVFHNARDIDLKRDLMKLSAGRGHLALGVGLGPFANVKAERTCARFLNECEFTGVRDPMSFEIARDIAPNANVAVTFDLAPQLLTLDGFQLQAVDRRGIAVCLCPHERLQGDPNAESKRLKELANALDTIQYFTQEPIYFVDFNGHAKLGDRQVHEELVSYLPTTATYHFVNYDANPLRVLQRMATFKLAISMRLHASVFGFLSQTPVISLNYHRKCGQWCEQIGLSAHDQFDVHQLDPQSLVNSVCVGLVDGFTAPKLSVQESIRRSLKNWRKSYENAIETSLFSCYSAL